MDNFVEKMRSLFGGHLMKESQSCSTQHIYCSWHFIKHGQLDKGQERRMTSLGFWNTEYDVQVAFGLFCQNLPDLSPHPKPSVDTSRWPEGREV